MESEGDYRGAIVAAAAREVRECLQSLNGLLTKAEGGSGGVVVNIQRIGGTLDLAAGQPPSDLVNP